jgi:AraC-like DNA-binding protein
VPRLRAAAVPIVATIDASGDIVQRVLEALLALGPFANVQAVAAALGTSVRTLQRRLAEQGRSVERLVESSRLTTARRLLDGTDAKVVDIAFDLGYSDHAHFTRAFRRWTGLSPAAYRRARLAPDAAQNAKPSAEYGPRISRSARSSAPKSWSKAIAR